MLSLEKKQSIGNTSISAIGINELESLQQISIQTFTETFAAVNTAENMQQYIQECLSLSKLESEIANPHASFYFATFNNQVIGYLKLNMDEAQTELKNEESIEIERIYVIKEFHGNGIGQLLFNKAIQVAKERNKDFLWLGVWEKNHRAIRFYEKNNLVVFNKHLFKLGEDVQTDLMMKYSLK